MTLQIDVISDVVCPWCYIGKRKLALAADAMLKSGSEIPAAADG